MANTIIIVVDPENPLLQDILDVISGKTSKVLKEVEHQTTSVLKQAEAISTDPPK